MFLQVVFADNSISGLFITIAFFAPMIWHADAAQVLNFCKFLLRQLNISSPFPLPSSIRRALLPFAGLQVIHLVLTLCHDVQPKHTGVLGAAVQSAFSLFLLPGVSDAGESSTHAFAHGL